MELKTIARIYCDLETKFGVPRQSGVAPHLCGKIVFEKEWRDKNAFKGIEKFSQLWIIWGFSEGFSGRDKTHQWSPTVRPPILGGNERIGVFATRSPNRPNPLGLTSVKLEAVDLNTKDGPVLYVSGIDSVLISGSPYSVPYSKVELNRLISEGMNFTISTIHTPSELIPLMSGVNLKLPVIVMDGAALYDINDNSYFETEPLDNEISNSAEKIIKEKKITF